ncbi:YbaB/EbfC family nucleoid-associated protein [Nonomuraea sp. NPDC052129]|uniref:YbaB/EbfC family nucleoid-associated protein n=1 Tax=Nonomuraea sp. NPDC052129 TaxID=3154651 RepID=UPI00341D56D6
MDAAEFRPEDLERITAQAEQMLLRVEEVRKEVDMVVGRGTGADGQVRVAAGANGWLVELVIAPRAMRLDSQKLAEELLRAAQQAQEEADRKAREVMADTLGESMPTQRELDDRFSQVLESFESSMDERMRAIDERRRGTI